MSITPEVLPSDVLEAIGRGETIEAIKLLRGHTGLGLAEARYVVDQYRAGQIAPAVPGGSDAGMPADVRAALERGQKIEAIKLLRGHTGLGLKEAKDWIEAQHPSVPEHSTVPPPTAQASSSWWWLIAVILAAVAAFALLRGPGAEVPL